MTALRLRIGTRASALARWQANWVAAQLASGGVQVELVPITTRGYTDRAGIAGLGAPGVFTKELEQAVLDGVVDLAVHSLKDLPTDVVEGLVLAAVPERASVRDVLISRDRELLERLPTGAVIGTGSLRRQAQLLHVRPDLSVRDIRGNIDTRLAKLAAGQYDAVVLAEAGLKRLGLEGQITEALESDVMLPAVGQGALAIQARSGDELALAAVAPLDHGPTHEAIAAERALLAALAGGCLAPVGAWARRQADGQLRLDAVVLSADGQRRIGAALAAPGAAAAQLGRDVASQLLAQGAAALIEQSRGAR
jgi:hydroxymethylbilane synthase